MSDVQHIEAMLGHGPNTYDLDENTKRLMEEQRKKLLVPSTEGLVGAVDQAGLMPQQQPYDFSVGLGGDTGQSAARVHDAITQRNQSQSQDYINTLKRELKLAEPARDAGNLRAYGQNLGREAEVKLNNNRIVKQWDLDKRRLEQYKQQQKDGILASILGIVGTITGVGLASKLFGATGEGKK